MKRMNLLALVLFLGACAAVMFLDTEATRRVQRAVGTLFAPFSKAGGKVQDALTSGDERSKTPEELKEENQALRRERDLLRLQQQMFESLEMRNKELTAALEFRKRYGFQLIPAEVVNRRISAWYREARIDKGLNDGVTEESPVISPVLLRDGDAERWEGALVGKIGRCESESAAVVLITDETCRVAAGVKGRSSVKGILMGSRGSVQATPDLRLRFLRAEPTLEPGTQIVSDGVSEQGVFPYGILLGEVKEFYKKDLGGEALVRPAVEIDTLKYVFVLRREEAAPPPPKAKPIAE